jgi:hypothetical protein
MLDGGVGKHQLPVERAHEGEQGRDHRAQAARQGQGLHAMDKALGTAGGHTVAVLAEQGADERDVARAHAHQGVADPEATAHMPLGIGESMSGAVGAEQAGLGQGAGIASVGLDRAGTGRLHGREVRVGDDDLVTKDLEAPGHPFAVGRGLDEDPRPGPAPEHRGEASMPI